MLCKKCGRSIPDDALYCPYCGKKQAADSPRKTKQRGNGSGTVYQTPNKKWRAEVRIYAHGANIRRTKDGFTRKRDALDYLPILRAGDLKKSDASPILRDLFDLWQQTKKYEGMSADKKSHYQTAWNRLQLIQHRDITTLSYVELQTLIDEAPGGHYPKRDMKTLLSHLYKIAQREELLPQGKNLAQFVELPAPTKSKRDAFTSEEIALLWRDYETGHRFAGYALVMIYTSMRTGELFALRAENVFPDKKYMIGGIKTEAGTDRVIPLAECILPVIREQLAHARKGGLIDMRIEEFYTQWAQLIERTGIRPLDAYCCRHTTATALAEKGVAPAVIKEIMGHTSYNTTLRYTHISVDEKVRAVNQMSDGSADLGQAAKDKVPGGT